MNLVHKVDIHFPKEFGNDEANFVMHKVAQQFPELSFKPNQNVFDSIRNWAKARGIYEKGDPKTQTLKLVEEQGELAKAILKQDKEEQIDAIGDCVVVLTNLAELLGLRIEACIASAYNVISSRQGKMENGTFVKKEI